MGASGLGSLLVKEGILSEQDRRTITKHVAKVAGRSQSVFSL